VGENDEQRDDRGGRDGQENRAPCLFSLPGDARISGHKERMGFMYDHDELHAKAA